MTTIPTIERTEKTKCHTCLCDCVKLCAICGRNFCTKHLLSHSEQCSGYKGTVRSILRDDLTEITKQIIEMILRTI